VRAGVIEHPPIAFPARRDLLGEHPRPLSDPCELSGRSGTFAARPPTCGRPSQRSQEDYDQIETFRQLSILTEQYGFNTRPHDAGDAPE
jgi:hypothetical protein